MSGALYIRAGFKHEDCSIRIWKLGHDIGHAFAQKWA